MPEPESHTPVRRIRVPDARWEKFGRKAGIRSRSTVINEFIRWYNGEPKARLPKRPDPKVDTEPAE